MPLKPSWHSQVNWPPAWLLQRPWGPQTFEEIYRSPSGVLLDATATVQLSITVKISSKEQNSAVKSLQTDFKWHKISQSLCHYPFFHLTAIQAIYLDIFLVHISKQIPFLHLLLQKECARRPYNAHKPWFCSKRNLMGLSSCGVCLSSNTHTH